MGSIDLAKEYYWGDCDKKTNLVGEDVNIEMLWQIWDIDKECDIDEIIGSAFDKKSRPYSIIKSIISTYVKEPDNDNLIDIFEDEFKSIDLSDFEWYQWDLVRRIFSGINAQYFAYLCKCNAEKCILSSDGKYSLLLRKYSILANRGETETLNDLMDKLETELRGRWKDRYLCLKDFHETTVNKSKIDDPYGKELFDKNVIILGVAPHEKIDFLSNGDTLYAHINYLNKDNLNTADKDLPINLSYYSVAKSDEYILKGWKYDVVPDYISLKCGSNTEIEKPYKNMRYTFPFMFGCPFGHPLLVPIILYDLMHYGCKSIYLTNSNFYYSEKLYADEYYQVSDTKAIKALLISMSCHDLQSNWKLTKTWYESKRFECDECTKEILDMTDVDFSNGIEKSFRKKMTLAMKH